MTKDTAQAMAKWLRHILEMYQENWTVFVEDCGNDQYDITITDPMEHGVFGHGPNPTRSPNQA